MNREVYAEILRQAAFYTGKRLVMDYLIARLPLLGSAFLQPFVGFFVGKILQIALEKTEMGAFFYYIDLRTSSQSREFQAAALKNAEIQKDKTKTKKEKIDAEKALVDAFRTFARFDT